MPQVFVRLTERATLPSRRGQCDWLGEIESEHRNDCELMPPESEAARAEMQKVLDAVPGIALTPIDGSQPHRFDVAHPFRVDASGGRLLKPKSGMADGRAVRWNFRERMLDIWKGRRGFNFNGRKTILREFLDYHLSHGGHPSAFRDYLECIPDERWHVDDMPTDIALEVMRLHGDPKYVAPDLDKSLADEVRAWTLEKKEAFAQALARPSDWVLVLGEAKDSVPGWVPNNPAQWIAAKQRGLTWKLLDVTDEAVLQRVLDWAIGEVSFPMAITAFGRAEARFGMSPPIIRTVGHWNGDSPYDLRCPFHYIRDWRGTGKTAFINDYAMNEGAGLMWEFRSKVIMQWDTSWGDPVGRANRLRAHLDHHANNGGSEARFIALLRRTFLENGLSIPDDLRGKFWIQNPGTPVSDSLKAELTAWIAEREGSAVQSAPPSSSPPTFEALLGEENVQAVRAAMKNAGIAHRTNGRGKEVVLAALHAACMHFGKQPSRLGHWPSMLQGFIPGSVWSDKSKPKDLDTASDRYKAAYHAMMSELAK